MEIAFFVLINALAHLCFVGARMTTTLFALDLGASEFTVGVLVALFAMLPMFLSVSAGRLVDRLGPRGPILVSLGVLALATALPFVFPRVGILYLTSTLAGTAFMYVHIAMNSVFGAHGTPEQRAVNFSWLALGFSISNSFGPLVAGYAIEAFGHAAAMLVLAAFPLLAVAALALRKRELPRPEHVAQAQRGGVLELLSLPALRGTFIVSALLSMGWDLYTFLIPLYGSRIGLSAGTIGVVMSTFAVATFIVRLFMTVLVKRLPQWLLIASAMALSGLAYLAFPFVQSAPLLVALSFVLGIGLGASQPVIMALLYSASPPGRQGEAVGIRTTMLNGSHTFIPLASGALSAAFGMIPVFALVSLLLLGGAWFAKTRHQGR
ncbi:MAG TPA: MFS transporter [Burkholderiales bacterium]|nr:MFS transporter [Burkholderiales bacterium]